ncbi:MAG: BspA family leucine-rich repeat surface protein [Luminiphilus sp.]|nr:BspA family leucine-rich repeat surface protein [Luminiphilus sp.]
MFKLIYTTLLGLALMLAGVGDAWSHTFALGLRAGDEGGVEVWFRTWHGCNTPLSEGWIRIKGINVDYPESIGEANLRSCASSSVNNPPQFELTTDSGYYCEVNSAGQILAKGSGVHPTANPSLGFDPLSPVTSNSDGFVGIRSDAAGAILCDTDIQEQAKSVDKWHGSLFVGLEPGFYDVEYLECNDVRALAFPGIDNNNCANGSGPSADFEIEYTLIAALPPIEVTPELAGKPPIEVLPGDDEISITYFAPDDGTVIDHYEFKLDSDPWTSVAPADELEVLSTGALSVLESTGTPSAGQAHFSALTFPAYGLLADIATVTVKLSDSPSGAPATNWTGLFTVGERIGFQQGNVFIDGKIAALSSLSGFSQFTLTETRKLAQRTLVAGQSITVGRLLPYAEVPRTIQVDGLTNDTSYSIEFRAVGVDGEAGDASQDQTEIPRPNCADVTAGGGGFPCQINGVVYEQDDLHILSTTVDAAAQNVCGTDSAYADHKLPAAEVVLCRQSGDSQTVRAIFDWDNEQAAVSLSWLNTVTQFGSRSESDDNCASETPSGRCEGRLANGYGAFRGMAGAGGDAIKNLNISDLSDMREMFKDAITVNLDLSGWDVSDVKLYDRFDEGASQWCGLGVTNQGRPIDWEAATEGCLDLDLESIPLNIVQTTDQLLYLMSATNQTETSLQGGTLQLVLPTGTQYNALYSPTPADSVSGQALTWTGITLEEGVRGAERAVAVDVPSSYTGTSMQGSATLTDTQSNLSVNKVLETKVGGAPDLTLTLSGPGFVLAGDSLGYELGLSNLGNRDAQTVTVSLSWDTDDGVVASSSSESICSGVPLNCEWKLTIPAGESWSADVMVTVPASTPMPLTLEATARAEINNQESAIAATRTIVDAQPELSLQLKAQPQRSVEPGATIVTETFFKNTGTAVASAVSVSLPLNGATLVEASAGGTVSGTNLVWSLGEVLPGASASILTARLSAPDPAPDSAQLFLTAARATATTPGGRPISEESAAIALAVTSNPTPELEMAFVPEHYTLGGPIDLVFTYRNESPSEVSGAQLTMRIPKDTSLLATPDGATCYSDRSEKTIDRMEPGFEVSTVLSLQVHPGALFSIAGGGLLSPIVQNEFLLQTATAEAYARQVQGINDEFTLNVAPEAGSGCTLAWMESVESTPLAGYTLLTDEFLSFTVMGCDLSAPESFTVQVDAGGAVSGGALLVKVDEDDGSVTPIEGVEFDGSVATYTLTDQGELDQDTTLGTLRDPVAFVLRNAGPVPLPLWLVGLVALLLVGLGYRNLKASTTSRWSKLNGVSK